MHLLFLLLSLLLFLKNSYATPVQSPLQILDVTHPAAASRQLHGRFLHITDLHPDPFYKVHSSTEEDDACHHGKGAAGTYGAETSDCDTPFSLVNATFKWIEENIKDHIDFVVWTGDSARHDSDEKIPRTQDEVLSTNRFVANKFLDVFGKVGDANKALEIPIVSTLGNNDILPHNILPSGPNKWLMAYADVWSKFIPEEQRHGFERGGWYYVEVIPNKLAVFSLNTLYFFSSNAAVDGCASDSEPGYAHMEWLRVQLQFMRQRRMKALLIGHVPPARTASKQLWDETCWQQYTLWLKQYRDVVIGGLYGHMNIDHFMLQDTKEVDLVEGQASAGKAVRSMMDEELSIESASDYLQELRENWSGMPNPPVAMGDVDKSKKKKKSKKDKALKKIGGPWGEAFQVSLVGPSVVPNFFPTLRVIEYNITGLNKRAVWSNPSSSSEVDQQMDWLDGNAESYVDDYEDDNEYDKSTTDEDDLLLKNSKKDKKKPSKPDLIIPDPPSKKSPPGPAYSPQTLTMLGYTQYYANLTLINNDQYVKLQESGTSGDDIDTDGWHEGNHRGKHPTDKVPHPKPFQYQIEYDTFTDPIFKLKDMTVNSYIKLAHRIGQYKPVNVDLIHDALEAVDKDEDDDKVADDVSDDDNDYDDDDGLEGERNKKKKRKKAKKKLRKQLKRNKVWLRFLQRAFIGTLDEEKLQSFELDSEPEIPELLADERRLDVHDGEL